MRAGLIEPPSLGEKATQCEDQVNRPRYGIYPTNREVMYSEDIIGYLDWWFKFHGYKTGNLRNKEHRILKVPKIDK